MQNAQYLLKTAVSSCKSCRYRALFFALIGVLVLLCYSNSLNGVFLFDDFGNIVGNKYIAITSLAAPEIQKVFSPNQNCNNRKIANLTFALNYYFGRLNPVGFHFINILIHMINAWLVFCLFQWYLKRSPLPERWNPVLISGFAALWWATNPIQTNAVTYIVQRMTSLSVMFCLISLLLYLQARSLKTVLPTAGLRPKRTVLFVVSLGFWGCAMLTKEIAAIFPLLILAHECYFFQLLSKLKENWKKYGIFVLIIGAVFIGQALYFMGPDFISNILKSYDTRSFTLLERLMTEPRVVFHYMGLFLFPLPTRLRLYYDTFPVSHGLLSPVSTFFALAGTVLWLLAVIFFFKKNRLLSFGMLWAFLTLLIEATVISLELVFDHRFYFPSIGFVLASTISIVWLLKKFSSPPLLFYVFISVLIGSQILGTITRNRVWADPILFSLDEVQKNPASARAYSSLGYFLIEQHNPVQAEKYLQQALLFNKNHIVTLVDLVGIYANPPFNDTKKKKKYIRQIIRLVQNGQALPNDTASLNNLSHYLFEIKYYADCLKLLAQVQKYDISSETFLHMGQCNIKLNQPKEAVKALEHALDLEPENSEILFNLAWAYQLDNNSKKAQTILSEISLSEVKDKKLKDNIIKLRDDLKQQTET